KSEPVEQLGMTRLLAHTAKILQGFDDAYAKQLLPVAVHSCSCGKRLSWRKKPFRQCQSVMRFSSRKGREYARYIGIKYRADLREKTSALELQSPSIFISRLLSHDWRFHSGNLFQLLFKRRETPKIAVVAGVRAEFSPARVAAGIELCTLHQRGLAG